VHKQTCAVCHKETDYVYNGPFYTGNNLKCICPLCIKDGTAAKKYNGVFQGSVEYKNETISICYLDEAQRFLFIKGDEEIDPIDDDKLNELFFNTPGYTSWQEPIWLSHCNEFCAFIKYIDKEEIISRAEELKDEIKQIENFYGINIQELSDAIGFYLFQCLKCGKYRIHKDYT
jgi:uncharacterized protein CbrC (UPF0167 family)